MKANHLLSAALLIAASLSSCSQEEQFGQPNEQQKQFMGTMEKVNSRVALDDDNMMNWEMNDKITIFPKFAINNCYEVSTINSTGAATFEFVDYIDADSYTTLTANYAVYPYYDNNSISGEIITSTVPGEIDYTGKEESIKQALMVAKSTGEYLNFTNAQGILRLCLNADQPFKYGPVKSIKFISKENLLTGTATMDYSNGDTPSAVISDGGSEEIVINLSQDLQKELAKATANEYSEFYIPVVPTQFGIDAEGKGDLTMLITFTDGGTYEKSVDLAFEIKRSKIFKLSHKLGTGVYTGEIEDVEEIWDGTTTTEVAPVTDDTTGETYYPVGKGSDLAWLAESFNNGTMNTSTVSGRSASEIHIKLTSDIDLGGKEWTPIGFNAQEETGNENYFTGTFDGNGYTISNLKIDVSEKGGVGLFGAVHNATFKNFTLNNVDIKAVERESDPEHKSGAQKYGNYIVGGHIGAVAGYDAKAGTLSFENVHVTGLIKIEGETRVSQGQRIGGIIGGKNGSTVNFNNVSVKGSEGSYIKGYCSTAGVMGQHQSTGTFAEVHTDIDIHAVTFGAGGIVGITRQGSTFTNCSSAGDITLDASKNQPPSYSANYPYRVGGIAGTWSESASGILTLTGCSYTGMFTSIDQDGNKVESFDYAGYVGRGYTLKNCAGSKVIIDDTTYVQADNTTYGTYYVNGLLPVAEGVCKNEAGEYLITNATGMYWFADEVNNKENYFKNVVVKLGADIDLNNEEWTPIGSATADHGFMGNFDGNGYAIKNLKITEIALDSDGYAYAGLFGVTEGTGVDNENYIKNLTIENVKISTEGHIVAAAIAYPYYTNIENVTVKGNVIIKGGNYTAGILAYTRYCINAKSLAVEGNNNSSIEGKSTVGGVISDIQLNVNEKVNYSSFAASGLTIKADWHVGGISGIISQQALDGAVVKNVDIKCDDTRAGIVSGSTGGNSTLTNVSYENVTGATRVIGGTYTGGYYVGQILEVGGAKAIVYTIEDGVKAVSVAQGDEMAWDAAKEWAKGLGEGWSLTSKDDLKAIHQVRGELNKYLAADDAENVLFEEDEKEDDGSYAAYWSSDLVEGSSTKAYYYHFSTEIREWTSGTMFPVEYSRGVYTIK